MSVPIADDPDPDFLRSVVEHVFMPPKLPQAGPGEHTEQKTNESLCNCLIGAARDFLKFLPSSQRPLWMQMIKMVELARSATTVPFEETDLQRALSNMVLGGTSV
jgi:hypothetical protein